MSVCQGKGSVPHNNREFSGDNIDKNRTKNNITYANEPLQQAYDKIFNPAIQRYNSNQKRADRKINTDYYSHLFGKQQQGSIATGSNKQKSFYEVLVQIGDKDDSAVGTPDGILVAKCLDEYMQGFQERNPNFYVFNAVLHLDEKTPHLHIDYIPVGHFARGLDTRNGMAQALKEMGYGVGKEAINEWRLNEREVLKDICSKYGVEISKEQEARGTLELPEYKKQKDLTRELEKTNEKLSLDNKIGETELELTSLQIKENKGVIEKQEEKKEILETGIINLFQDYTEKKSKYKKSLEALGKAIKEAEQENARLKQSYKELGERINALKGESEGLEDKIKGLKAEKSTLESENRVMKEEFEKIKGEVESQEERKEILSSEVEELEQKKIDTKNEVENATSDLLKAEEGIKTYLAEKNRLKGQVEGLKNEVKELGEEKAIKQGELDTVTSELESKNVELEDIVKLEKQRDDLTEEIDGLLPEKLEIELSLRDGKNEVEKIKQEATETKEALVKENEELREETRELKKEAVLAKKAYEFIHDKGEKHFGKEGWAEQIEKAREERAEAEENKIKEGFLNHPEIKPAWENFQQAYQQTEKHSRNQKSTPNKQER